MKQLLRILSFSCALLGLAARPFNATAQRLQISNANPTFICPGKTYSYSGILTTSSGNDFQCRYNWTPTGGQLTVPNQQDFPQTSVQWNDVPAGQVTLKVEFNGGCSTAANNNATPDTRTFYIRSVTNQTLGALTLDGSTSGNIEFGSPAPVTLEVPYLLIPRNANDPEKSIPLTAEGYEWTIPAGWLWPDGSASTGAPRLFNSRSVPNPNRIQVTPPGNACGGGALVVRVRAVDTECAIGAQPGYVATRSAEKTLTVNCVLPTLRIASNGAPAIIRCADVRDFGFRADPQGGQGGTFAYNWTTTNNWTPATATGLVPGIRPSGSTGTTITLGGTYSRSGLTASLVPVQLTIGYNNQVAAPVLNVPGGFLLCYNESFQLTPSGNPM